MSDTERKPTILIDFKSPDHNIFTILGKAVNAIRASNDPDAKEKELELRQRFTKAHDYKEALRIIGEYVNIVALGGEMP